MKQVCKGYSGKVGIMDTIKNYLENLFCNVGVNEEVLRLKQDLYNNMEEKYMELKREGHSENEAIGMVISNFGNIDELLKELGVEKPAAKKGRFLSQTEVEDLVYNQKRWSKFIGIGVFLILAAVAVLILSGVVLEKVEFYRGASFTRFQSGPSANSVITLTGDYNKSYNFVHLYILENEPNRSFAQLSTETKYRMKSEDVDKIILFLQAVR